MTSTGQAGTSTLILNNAQAATESSEEQGPNACHAVSTPDYDPDEQYRSFGKHIHDFIELVKGKANRVDVLEAENVRLQTELEQLCGLRAENDRLRLEVERHRSLPTTDKITSTEAVATAEHSCPSAEVAREQETVSLSKYNLLVAKCEGLRAKCAGLLKQRDSAKKQGGTFKKAFKVQKAAYQQLHERRSRDKEAIKSWVVYAQRLKARRREIGGAYYQFLQDVENVADLILAGAMDLLDESQSIDGAIDPVEEQQSMAGAQEDNIEDPASSLNLPNPIAPVGSSQNSAVDLITENLLPAGTPISSNAESANNLRHVVLDGQEPRNISASAKETRSSQTTADERENVDKNNEKHPIEIPESGSDPILVSTKALKRKRAKCQQGDALKAGELTVKSEPNNSPVSYKGIAPMFNSESMDLDNTRHDLTTPRKRRKFARLVSRLGPYITQEQFAMTQTGTRSTSAPVAAHSSFSEGDVSSSLQDASRSAEQGVRPVKSESPSHCSRLSRADRNTHTEQQRFMASEPASPSLNSRALEPLNVNNQVLPRTSTRKVKTQRRKDLAGAIAQIAQPGDPTSNAYPSPASSISSRHRRNGVNPVGTRLNSLLETPLSKKQLLTPQHTAERTEDHVRSAKRTISRNKDEVTELHTAAVDSRPAESGPTDAHQSDAPLRNRPLSDLGPDDFTVNPNYNPGYDYAFSEVVRNRDQRRCLPNCTRPECCGNRFEKMVELGGAPQPSRRLWDSSQTDDDQRLLESYLGGPGEGTLARIEVMGPEEKRQMLTKARAEQLAQSIGRHRHAFQRPPTPPGFWRADFPTTQEVEADKEETLRLERQKVEERYLSALRGDGAWVFRDEL